MRGTGEAAWDRKGYLKREGFITCSRKSYLELEELPVDGVEGSSAVLEQAGVSTCASIDSHETIL